MGTVANSCFNWSEQRQDAGSPPNSSPSECYQSNTVGYNSALPCACAPHPHIHGGVWNSVYNTINVKLTPYALGYISYMLPF
jgi:hypothetical protein